MDCYDDLVEVVKKVMIRTIEPIPKATNQIGVKFFNIKNQVPNVFIKHQFVRYPSLAIICFKNTSFLDIKSEIGIYPFALGASMLRVDQTLILVNCKLAQVVFGSHCKYAPTFGLFGSQYGSMP